MGWNPCLGAVDTLTSCIGFWTSSPLFWENSLDLAYLLLSLISLSAPFGDSKQNRIASVFALTQWHLQLPISGSDLYTNKSEREAFQVTGTQH